VKRESAWLQAYVQYNGLVFRNVSPYSWIFSEAGFILLGRDRELSLAGIHHIGCPEELPLDEDIIPLSNVYRRKAGILA
jgi:hypothetical protein